MKKWLRRTLIILFSAIFLVSATMVAIYYINSNKQKQQFDTLSDMVSSKRPPRPEIPASTEPAVSAPTEPGTPDSTLPPPTEPVETEPPGPLPEYAEVSALNSDMAGWLQIEGTRIDYPVMHTPDRPEYYLYKNFYGEYSSHGCLFAREVCSIDPASDNITIYGHNMKDGSMFSALKGYKTKSFWEQHRYIYFDTLTERHTYEIFAVFKTTATKGRGFTYHHYVDAEDEAEFQFFVDNCKSLSLYDTGIDPVYGDKFITLSTCEYSQKNGRLVVVARRVI